MLGEEFRPQCHDLRTKPEHEHSQDEESNQASHKNGQQEMPEVHFEYGRGQCEHFEWKWRRHHGGNHQRPELMPVELIANSFEFCARYPLQQQNLTPSVTDPVKQDAACRRPSCGQQRIEKRMRAILINVSRNHRIKRYTEESGINSRHGEYCPRAQRLKQRPHESDIARDEMFQDIQWGTSSRATLRRPSLDAAEPECASTDATASG